MMDQDGEVSLMKYAIQGNKELYGLQDGEQVLVSLHQLARDVLPKVQPATLAWKKRGIMGSDLQPRAAKAVQVRPSDSKDGHKGNTTHVGPGQGADRLHEKRTADGG